MKWTLALVAALTVPAGVTASARPPLSDPVMLNIGMSCQWQQRCMSTQQKAMERALKYVRKKQPATWRVQQCNRNAARSRYRVDWVGFNNCVRNAELRYTPPPRPVVVKKRVRRLTQTNAAPVSSPAPAAASLGERGQ